MHSQGPSASSSPASPATPPVPAAPCASPNEEPSPQPVSGDANPIITRNVQRIGILHLDRGSFAPSDVTLAALWTLEKVETPRTRIDVRGILGAHALCQAAPVLRIRACAQWPRRRRTVRLERRLRRSDRVQRLPAAVRASAVTPQSREALRPTHHAVGAARDIDFAMTAASPKNRTTMPHSETVGIVWVAQMSVRSITASF